MKKKFIPNVWDAVKRFPATVLFCLLSTGLWMYLYKTKSFKSHTELFFSFLIGIFIFVPLTQFSEKSSKKILKIILNMLGFIFLALFYYSIKIVGDKVSLYRLFLFWKLLNKPKIPWLGKFLYNIPLNPLKKRIVNF